MDDFNLSEAYRRGLERQTRSALEDPQDQATESKYPAEWLLALEFTKHACEELGIYESKERIETLRVLLIICC